jgi:hypothetical protein
MLEAVSGDDVKSIIAAMVKAAREILDRVVGKAAQTDVLQRLEALEQMLGAVS